jgi:UDP-N-acetylglucosamine acyltransferase
VARIDPSARVADGARLGADVEIGPFTVVGPHVELGDGCRLSAHVVVDGRTQIGPRTVVHPFTSLGTPPQAVRYRGEPSRLVIGSDCIIHEHVTANLGTEEGGMETRIGNKCLLMVGVHVGHDAKVGNEVRLANFAMLGGHVEIEDYAIISAIVAAQQFTRVGAYAFIGGGTGVVKDVIPFGASSGWPPRFRGLNAVGMRRRGFTREAIQAVREAFKMLFADSGPMLERADRLAAAFPGDANVGRIVEFIRAGKKRPFLLPQTREAAEDFEEA